MTTFMRVLIKTDKQESMNKNARPLVASTLRRTIIIALLALVAMAGQGQPTHSLNEFAGMRALRKIFPMNDSLL